MSNKKTRGQKLFEEVAGKHRTWSVLTVGQKALWEQVANRKPMFELV